MPIQLVENSVVAGRFKLNRLLGRGGMGSVWHATHLGLDIPCAVKFIEGEYAQMAEAQSRFEREAKAAAQLRSPHVVQILDHGVCEGTPYIAMELLDGEDLGKRLAKVGRMHPREVNTIMQQTCRALSKAHTLGIVHRDLKPDNIFLVRDDDREIAKVLDFGIAKHNSNALEGSNTKTGAMLGTPYYMSPEQAQGIKSVDFRSDLWSLAVIVFQAVTGKLPFDSEALGDLLVKIIVQPMPVPSQLADVPPNFDRWWEKAAAREPTQRFQSAKEFAESLQMVFGLSQMTDVMDRGQLRAALGGTPNPSNPNNPMMLTPGGYQPVPTPGNYAPMPTPGGQPAPYAQTPQPGAPQPGAPQPGQKFASTTGAPMARTYGDAAAGVPSSRKGGAVAAIAGGLTAVVVIGGIITAVVVSKGKPSAAASSPPAAETTQVAPPPAAPAPASSPAPVAVNPTPAAPATAAPAVDPTPAAPVKPAADPPKTTHHSTKPTATPAAPGGQPAAPPKPAPKPAGNPNDLGF